MVQHYEVVYQGGFDEQIQEDMKLLRKKKEPLPDVNAVEIATPTVASVVETAIQAPVNAVATVK